MASNIRFYNRLTIILFSAIGSTIFGALLYAQNLSETGNRKYIAPTLIFSIVFSFAGFALTSRFGIEYYYSFIPIHLFGGLLLAFPFWNKHFKSIESYKVRKVWGPIFALLIPVSIIIFLNIFGARNKLNAGEFQQKTITSIMEAMEKEIYIANDSSFNFFDLSIPLAGSSYYFVTEVEGINTIFNDIVWEDGYFRVICSRIPLSENENYDQIMFEEKYDTIIYKKCPTDELNTAICADFAINYGDTLMLYGEIASINHDRIVYYFCTQYSDLDRQDAADLSNDIITKIKLLHPTKAVVH